MYGISMVVCFIKRESTTVSQGLVAQKVEHCVLEREVRVRIPPGPHLSILRNVSVGPPCRILRSHLRSATIIIQRTTMYIHTIYYTILHDRGQNRGLLEQSPGAVPSLNRRTTLLSFCPALERPCSSRPQGHSALLSSISSVPVLRQSILTLVIFRINDQ